MASKKVSLPTRPWDTTRDYEDWKRPKDVGCVTFKKKPKNGRGRPPKHSVPVLVRLAPDDLGEVDRFARNQPDKPSRPEAIRRMAFRRSLGGI
jgi:hypothetical protein